jgi:hypothetical protein
MWPGADNARLIAEAVNALRALLDALDAAEREREGWRAVLETQRGDTRATLTEIAIERGALLVERRTLGLALSLAQRAFEGRDAAALGTVNETIQPLVDAAMAWVKQAQGERDEARAAATLLASVCLGCGQRDGRVDEDGLCTLCGGAVVVSHRGDVEAIEEYRTDMSARIDSLQNERDEARALVDAMSLTGPMDWTDGGGRG